VFRLVFQLMMVQNLKLDKQNHQGLNCRHRFRRYFTTFITEKVWIIYWGI